MQARLVHKVTPKYPADAKRAHIAGTVVLHAVIARDGTVKDLVVVSGPPMLTQASVDAVKQWIYEPTQLMGQSVEVDTTISVVYTLGGNSPPGPQGEPSQSAMPQSPSPAPAGAMESAPSEPTPAIGSSVASNPELIAVEISTLDFARTHTVDPIYPKEAIQAHVSGTVLLHAVVSGDGRVKDVEYVSGPKMLAPAAIDAVRQWTYEADSSNAAPIEVGTNVFVVFALGENPPPDLWDSSGYAPMSYALAVMPPNTSPKYPDAARRGRAAYPDTLEGMKAQMEGALEIGRLEDDASFYEALDSFAIDDPKAWLTANFGPSDAVQLQNEYMTSLFHFKEYMARMRSYWNQSATSYLQVQLSLVPKPPEGDENSKPPRPISPLPLEDFRFNIFTGKTDPGDWVFSFAYVDGAFRIVGGTFAFWDDDWSRSRAQTPFRRSIVDIARSQQISELMALNKGVEGVESMCPGDGLVRVFMSPKVAEERLKQRVEPVYPEEAKQKGIEGTVIFQAIIARDGTVENLELEDGDPILAKAAEAAVSQWRYEPMIYYESGASRKRPAEMDTAIKVEFKLPQ